MAYNSFVSRVQSLIARAGGGIGVSFSVDNGRFVASCTDGTTIIGNPSCSRVSVRWGSGHEAIAEI